MSVVVDASLTDDGSAAPHEPCAEARLEQLAQFRIALRDNLR